MGKLAGTSSAVRPSGSLRSIRSYLRVGVLLCSMTTDTGTPETSGISANDQESATPEASPTSRQDEAGWVGWASPGEDHDNGRRDPGVYICGRRIDGRHQLVSGCVRRFGDADDGVSGHVRDTHGEDRSARTACRSNRWCSTLSRLSTRANCTASAIDGARRPASRFVTVDRWQPAWSANRRCVNPTRNRQRRSALARSEVSVCRHVISGPLIGLFCDTGQSATGPLSAVLVQSGYHCS
jgi:hypothetical protein